MDAEAARNAGMVFIAVLSGVTAAKEFSRYKPLAIVSTIDELRTFDFSTTEKWPLSRLEQEK